MDEKKGHFYEIIPNDFAPSGVLSLSQSPFSLKTDLKPPRL